MPTIVPRHTIDQATSPSFVARILSVVLIAALAGCQQPSTARLQPIPFSTPSTSQAGPIQIPSSASDTTPTNPPALLASPSSSPSATTPLQASNSVAQIATPPSAEITPPDAPKPSAPPNLPQTPPEPQPSPELGPFPEWVDWERFLASYQWPSPILRTNGVDRFLESKLPSGSIRILPGQRRAYFHDLHLIQGFETRWIQNRIHVHHLDIKKTWIPLLGRSERPPLSPATNNCIVLDPGHGGINGGSRCIVGNTFEKDFTLDWALQLKPLLEKAGWNVLLTRESDEDRTLAERVEFAEKAQAALFVSLHFNSSFPRTDAEGIETYCLTPTGMASTLTRQYSDEIQSCFPNNAQDSNNWSLAEHVHRALIQQTGAPDRGLRRARFMEVLRGQNRPAILIEGGYLSNPSEARKITNSTYRAQLARAVAHALGSPNSGKHATASLPIPPPTKTAAPNSSP